MNTEQTSENMDDSDYTKIPKYWFRRRFPDVFKKHGDAVEQKTTKDGEYIVAALKEDFLAETIGFLGNPKTPAVYVGREDRFYRYEHEIGIYVPLSENQILAYYSSLLQKCADECHKKDFCDTTSLRFHLSKTGQLKGVIAKAKGMLCVPEDYFNSDLEKYVACRNGMLRLSDMELLPFSADFRRRNKLSVPFFPDTQCPLFMDTLMRQALDDDDILFLQKWFGLALLGKNMPQVIVILSGTAQGGKSTFVKIVYGVIGKENVATLRTEQLNQRFETASFLGKTLLHGADVPANFLTQKSASVLKSLTGGDSLSVELKNGRERPEIEGNFNVIIVSNSHLVIRLEGDTEAWRRRLAIIPYRKPKPEHIITSLADLILKDEGSGVLNWAIAGLLQLRKDEWCFKLTETQKKVRDKTLLESDSPQQFVETRFEKDENATLTQEDCFGYYVEYCKKLEWTPLPRTTANPIIENQIMRHYAISQRNDIKGSIGTAQRGWKGIRVKV
jgi:P4 family phage/plasmid primase-like protien